MSAQIQAGDLVVVVRNHCTDLFVGHVYTVLGIRHSYNAYCGSCLNTQPSQDIAELSWPLMLEGAGLPLAYLKRIPPLADLERGEIVRELTA